MSEERLQDVHTRALRILDQVGVKVSDPRLARRTAGATGPTLERGRVMFDPALVAELTGLDRRYRPPATSLRDQNTSQW